MRMVGAPTLAVVLTGMATVAGCGPTERAPDAAGVVDRFQAALEREDGAAACEELGEPTTSRLEQQEQAPCEQAILGIDLPRGGTAAKTSVYVTSASVEVDARGTTFLDEGPEGWKVAAAGCRPTAPELPYDCLLED